MADKKNEKLIKKSASKISASPKKAEVKVSKEEKASKIEKVAPEAKEEKKEEQVTQYYVLPDNIPTQQSGQDLGFGIQANAGSPDQGVAAKRKMRKKEGSIASGIVAYVLFAVGVICGFFGIYLKTVLFVDQVSSFIFTIFGFGIFVYGLIFIGIILQIISMILAFVQIGQNRKAFSIVTVCIVPLLNVAATLVEIYFLFSTVA